MGCKQSSSGENDDGNKRKRRNSGLILIENKQSHVEKVVLPKSTQGIAKNETIPAMGNNLSDESKAFIKRALLRSGVFTDEVDKRNISAADIEKIVESFEPRSYEDGEYLFHQNDFPCDTVFIAKRGIFRGLDGSHCKAIMRSKDIIGELGFFHQNPRMLSVVAGGTSPAVFALNKRDFKAIVEKGRDLKNMKIMEALSEAQKYLIKDRVTIANFVRGQFVSDFLSPFCQCGATA
jgi:Cyclic nucleotide-binding domain